MVVVSNHLISSWTTTTPPSVHQKWTYMPFTTINQLIHIQAMKSFSLMTKDRKLDCAAMECIHGNSFPISLLHSGTTKYGQPFTQFLRLKKFEKNDLSFKMSANALSRFTVLSLDLYIANSTIQKFWAYVYKSRKKTCVPKKKTKNSNKIVSIFTAIWYKVMKCFERKKKERQKRVCYLLNKT